MVLQFCILVIILLWSWEEESTAFSYSVILTGTLWQLFLTLADVEAKVRVVGIELFFVSLQITFKGIYFSRFLFIFSRDSKMHLLLSVYDTQVQGLFQNVFYIVSWCHSATWFSYIHVEIMLYNTLICGKTKYCFFKYLFFIC